jgi:hypothetical protein
MSELQEKMSDTVSSEEVSREGLSDLNSVILEGVVIDKVGVVLMLDMVIRKRDEYGVPVETYITPCVVVPFPMMDRIGDRINKGKRLRVVGRLEMPSSELAIRAEHIEIKQ